MLRKLLIRFKDDGDYFREIDEERNYFLQKQKALLIGSVTELQKKKGGLYQVF